MTLWYRLSASAPRDQQDAVVGIMMQVAPGGLEIEESVELLGPEQGVRVREDEPVTVHAYLPAGELGAVLIDDLRHLIKTLPNVELIAKPIYQEDWAVSWREFFGAVDPGGRIIVVPSWIEHEVPPGKLALRVDPGQAFGTGHHETTRLCLLSLDDHIREGSEFLDVGTGSGILSMAALLLGAKGGVALDIDPAAVEVARGNLEQAGVSHRIELSRGSLDADHGRTYDCVVANIFADPLIEMAPAFARAVRPEGVLIVSGVLAEDGQRVADAMADAGLTLLAFRYEGEWCAIDFQNRQT